MRLTISALTVVLASVLASAQTPSVPGFHHAIRHDDLSTLRTLIAEQGANARDAQGQTPLVHAAAFGTADAVQLLLDAGADPNAPGAAGITALHVAARDIRKVQLLLAGGADVHARSALGATPLSVAAATNGAAGVVALLLEKGARVNDRDSTGRTPLAAAAGADHTAAVRLLLAAGADIGDPPALFGAAMHGNAETMRLLLDRKADVQSRAPDVPNVVKNGPIRLGRLTALHFAVTSGRPEVVRLLLDAGAAVNAQDIRGLTSLTYAIATDRPDPAIVRMLLGAGADMAIRDSNGESVLDWARKFNDPAVLGELKLQPVPIAAHESTNGTARLPSAQTAVERGVLLMRTSSARVMSDGGCVACHAQPMAAMVAAAAERRGWQVEGPSTALQQSLLAVAGSAPLNLQAYFAGGVEVQLFIAMMMAEQGVAANAATDALVHLIAARQREDGNWQNGNGGTRAPMQDGNFTRTALSIRAMAAYGTPALRAEFASRVRRGAEWLAAQQPVSTEDRSMQLLGLTWAGSSVEGRTARAAKLIALQRADGGWGQTPNLPSDAYATGQALYALKTSGADVPGAVFDAGSHFLLRTQAADGSWHVVNRAMKFQPYFESGFPYEHDQWISQMGTAWATLALAAMP